MATGSHSSREVLLALAFVICCLEAPRVDCSTDVADIRWYRTAQNTADRLTEQPGLNFGGDFAMDQVIMIKR